MSNYDEKIVVLQSRLDDHILEFRRHSEEEAERWNKLIEITQENSKNTAMLIESTHDMVEAWNTASSVVKAGTVLGKFIKWLSGFAVVGAAAVWVIEHFGNPPPGH